MGSTTPFYRIEFKFISLSMRRMYISIFFLYNLIYSKINCNELLAMLNFRIPCYETRHTPLFNNNFERSNVMVKSCYNLICNNCDIFQYNPNKFFTAVLQITHNKVYIVFFYINWGIPINSCWK